MNAAEHVAREILKASEHAAREIIKREDFLAEWGNAAPAVQVAAIRGALRQTGWTRVGTAPVAFHEIQLFGVLARAATEADAVATWFDAARNRFPFA
ncbi:hypothetical protein DSD19_06110 [Rhodovulum sp. BSW8]|uniref:hypothetical protein n=1 Tax=Rhodovulum sp. BSW8 TaxID=2259645 RepID=UPI000DE33722|nr:hypothetical protein [Rhodovulum sp. BSW8]RBO54034.1 hypothetical protein DSD19_06110 [Rhodovulum sp. BSW8]